MNEVRRIQRCLDALNDGARTSLEVSIKTKIPTKQCWAYLHRLEQLGAAARTGELLVSHQQGRRAIMFEPKMFHVGDYL